MALKNLRAARCCFKTEENPESDLDKEPILHLSPPLNDQLKPHLVAKRILGPENGTTQAILQRCHVYSLRSNPKPPHGPDRQRIQSISNDLHNRKSLAIWSCSVIRAKVSPRLVPFIKRLLYIINSHSNQLHFEII